jgi:hypothetical protein
MNKNIYYPTYTINPESIYGSGMVTANKFPHTDTTTSVITDSFPVNKKLSPPVYRSGVSKKPLDTNGYRVLKNKYGETYKLDDYYYPTQQSNKNMAPDIQPTLKEKIKKKIKDVANKIVNDDSKLNVDNTRSNTRSTTRSKNNKSIQNLKFENIDDDTDNVINYIGDEIKKNNDLSPTDNMGRNKKMWIDDHYLYSLEPRYNSVVYPWRAYTWMYPVTPNSDNYYIDNINSSPPDPIIVSNDSTTRLNWQGTNLASNLLKENFDSSVQNNGVIEEKYQQNKCFQNYNILYFIIIVLILSIYFYKE